MRLESTVFSGNLAHLLGDPFERGTQLEVIRPGSLLVDAEGKILACGPRDEVMAQAPGAENVDFGPAWLLPGLIDGHIHFPQTFATASSSGQLLQWLESSIFPEEMRLADAAYAARVARVFVDQMLASGTTMAGIFGSQFFNANRLLLDELGRRGMRAIVGSTLMDQNGPKALCLNPDAAEQAVEDLIDACGAFQDISCAITPRFALSCSAELLARCGALSARHPQCFVQTHINENPKEVAAVHAAFPQATSYLDVYDSVGLVGPKTIMAHSIHTAPRELDRLKERDCVVCHCPSSNLFLGSGLFPLRAHQTRGIRLLLGTDVGAGTTFSVLEEMGHAFRVQKLRNTYLTAGQLLHLGTLGAARALGRESDLGNFAAGKWADFIVLDPDPDGYVAQRLAQSQSAEEQLLALLLLDQGRSIKATYIAGQERWTRAN